MANQRTIRYDNTFHDQAKLLELDARRLDQVIEGAIWKIANYAEKCEIVESKLRVTFTDDFPDAPAMRIYFQIENDDLCVVHWIEYLERDNEVNYWE